MSEDGGTDVGGSLAERLGAGRAPDAETLNMACFWITRSLEGLDFSNPAAAPLVRCLLRVAGRVIIDTAAADAASETWTNTEEMALLWIDEAIRPLGYAVRPAEGGGRPELPDVSQDWH